MSETLRLEHDIRAPGHARHWITQRCHEWHCDDLADLAALLISELVTNVFLHARTECLVHADFDHPLLTVTVTDRDNEGLLLHSPSTSGEYAEHGRGLDILAMLADTWGIQHNDGAKSVWFHIHITTDDPRT
jgi:anti-sigma regulatory factor (Ser/Thr protein kinase)